MARDPDRSDGVERVAGAGEEVAHHQRGVTHHVVQYPAALQPSLPEPGHMGAAVLLGRPSEVRPAGQGGTAGPEELPASLDLGREALVLQVAMLETGSLHQLADPLGLGHVPRQGFLAGDAPQLSLAPEDSVGHLLHILDSRMVGAAEPDRVDGRIGHQVSD